MKKLTSLLSKLPPWFLTIVVVGAILWLTLSPRPLGETEIPLFPGADKIAHALMFGGLAFVAMIDFSHIHDWRSVTLRETLVIAALSSLLGILIEFAQAMMGYGRSLEGADMISDTIGSFLCSWIWFKVGPHLLSK